MCIFIYVSVYVCVICEYKYIIHILLGRNPKPYNIPMLSSKHQLKATFASESIAPLKFLAAALVDNQRLLMGIFVASIVVRVPCFGAVSRFGSPLREPRALLKDPVSSETGGTGFQVPAVSWLWQPRFRS